MGSEEDSRIPARGLGGLAGSQIGSGHEGTMAAIAGLSLAGAYIGSEIGQDMDEADRREMQRRTREALERSPSGATSTWNNPDTGNYGTITPAPGYVENGRYCRPYTQTISVDNETRTIRGTACRQSDGAWVIVDTGQ